MISIKYKKLYDEMLEHYKSVHVNPWHSISEDNLSDIYETMVNSMDINDEYSFSYFLNYIIKRLCGDEDAHTRYDSLSLLPMNFKIFGNDVLINYPDDLKGNKLIAINNKDVNDILLELDEVITYGTEGKRRYELEKSLFDRNILFGLPSLRNCNELSFEIGKSDGSVIIKTFSKTEKYDSDNCFSYKKYTYGDIASYFIKDEFLIYKHQSLQSEFENKIKTTIKKLKQEDLINIKTIIVDIRGNTGGNSALNKYLMDFLKEHKDKKMICLTDYRVFSAGRYALIDLIKLGAITIGEEISTPINCYGNNDWKEFDGHWFSASSYYFNPLKDFSVSSKEEYQNEVTPDLSKQIIFKPDVLINQDENDYINGKDTIMNKAMEYAMNDEIQDRKTI